jgi:protein-S-isoprenylcysteine O-methyltransferase Ste14
MSGTEINPIPAQPAAAGLDAYGRRRIVQVLSTLIIAAMIIFICAGSLGFVWGWVYLGVSLISLAFGAAYVLRHNPQAINERGRPAEGQKGWDKILMLIYLPLFISVYVVAGLDARFDWSGTTLSSVPIWLHLVGVLLTFFGAALTYAAMAHNKFLSMYVQVAQERGHQVATEGPYRYVRHPMYLSLVVSWPALALLLGSYYALIPGMLASLVILIRTGLEDRTLQAELPGYANYAHQVRFRLLPGVW